VVGITKSEGFLVLNCRLWSCVLFALIGLFIDLNESVLSSSTVCGINGLQQSPQWNAGFCR